LQSWTPSSPSDRPAPGCGILRSEPSGGPDCVSPDRDAADGIPSNKRDEPCTSPANIASGWPGNPDRRESSPFAMLPSWRADIPASCSTEDSSAVGREENTHRNDNTTPLPSFHRQSIRMAVVYARN
jgi:hypothetical protein